MVLPHRTSKLVNLAASPPSAYCVPQAICAIYSRRSSAESSSSARGRPSQQRRAAPGEGASSRRANRPTLYGYTIVRELPHQQEAFTQGLEFERRCAPKAADEKKAQCRDILWESTGGAPPLSLLPE